MGLFLADVYYYVCIDSICGYFVDHEGEFTFSSLLFCVSGFITIDEILLIEISPNPTAMPSSYTIYKYSVNRKIRISEM